MPTIVFQEIHAIYRQWCLWLTLARQDIKLRYRRSILGPLWITISMAITIYSMGFLYGRLFHIELANYLPYLASGVIGWSLISNILLESTQVFVDAEPYIKSQESFLSLFMMRLIIRNIIVFLHNIITFIPIVIIFKIKIGFEILLLIPAVMMIGVIAFFWGTILGIVGARYRDFQQIISSVIQVIFFMTPIMWMPDNLPLQAQWFIKLNPLNHLLNLIRYPLIHNNVSIEWGWILLLAGSGILIYTALVQTFKNRVVFWL